MVWFIMAGMAAIAALAAIWPVLRASPPSADSDPATSEAAFYKAQLDEIQRDVERGQLPQSEAASARAEAARRLITLRSEAPKASSPAYRRVRLAVAVAIAIGVPVIALPLYAYLGQPQMPDQPLASRPPASLASNDVEAAVAGVESHLIAKPDDGKGWAVIAPVYMRLERYEDAARAYSEALRLLGEDGGRRAAYGEALVAAGGGVVTDKARETFVKALAEEPGQPQARFYLALAAEQDGKTAEAIGAYEALVADAPPDAHWVEAVKTRLASLKGATAPGATGAPAAVPEAQNAMIEGMVIRLANRLASDGGSVDEWSRLIRAYTVLHEADKAKAALANARKALAPDPNAVAGLDALAHDLGLGDAN
jgi:cytochrome c-type biogenesis protein CcmH